MSMTKWRKQPSEVQLSVWLKTYGRCWYCGVETSMDNVGSDENSTLTRFTIDHLTPRRFDGSDDIDNLVPACWSCNSAKHTKSVEQFRDMLRWRGIGKFTINQIEWLKSHGIELPEPPKVIFYFEQIGEV